MLAGIDLRYKKEIVGPESEFVNCFLSKYKNDFFDKNKSTTIFSEPFVGSGFPDIVIVNWDKSQSPKWNIARNQLKQTDIKILHHMLINKNYYTEKIINSQLGFPLKEVKNSLKRMKLADLIIEDIDGKIYLAKDEELFFIQSIIAIEAKIGNWKKAFIQAETNQWFSSESFVLLPDQTINSSVLDYAMKSTVGLISFNKHHIKIIKEPQKQNMPVSFCSWVFNENIGRTLWRDEVNFCGAE